MSVTCLVASSPSGSPTDTYSACQLRPASDAYEEHRHAKTSTKLPLEGLQNPVPGSVQSSVSILELLKVFRQGVGGLASLPLSQLTGVPPDSTDILDWDGETAWQHCVSKTMLAAARHLLQPQGLVIVRETRIQGSSVSDCAARTTPCSRRRFLCIS